MKHLKTYKLYESYKKHLSLSLDIAKEICLDLEDDGYDVTINTISEVPDWAKDYIDKGMKVTHKHQNIIIEISKLRSYFEYDDIKDTVERLINVIGQGELVDDKLKGRNGFKLTDYPGWGDVTKYVPKVYHYWRSDRHRGGLFNIPGIGSMWVKKTTTKDDDIERCLKSEIKLVFTN